MTLAPDLPENTLAPQIHSIFAKGTGKESVRIIPLGGLEEFGMNMMCYECGGERIVVDCGAMFPDADMLGVDLVIPDVSSLLDEPEKLKAIVLTHAHEDHIGALPYILPSLPVPIYGSAFTLAFLKAKLEEYDLADQTDLVEMEYRKSYSVGKNFEIRAIHVTHSIPGAAAISIRTPAGVIIHTGDYKIDHAPLSGDHFDFTTLAQQGEEGVLALVADSTNSDVPGSTHTERWVKRHLEPIFSESPRALFCTMFSTSVYRMQVMMDLAEQHDRYIFVAGRSMERTIGIASELGYLRVPRDRMRTVREVESIPPHRRFILAAGSQAEPLSSMSRIALGAHKQLKIEAGDAVIMSARIIPGHLRPISRMMNHLFKRGVRVYDSTSYKVHASGHAYREEMKTLISIVRPKYLLPAHGELRQLHMHRELAIGMGYDPDSIFMLQDGDVLEMNSKRARIVDKVHTGHVLVDGKTVGETGEVVLRDRQHLSEDGMLIAILNVDAKTGELLNDPEIVTRGFIYVDESEDLINELRDLVRDAFEGFPSETREDQDVLNAELRRVLKRHIRKNYERFPLILPVVQEL
jgi:ribonuclease J